MWKKKKVLKSFSLSQAFLKIETVDDLDVDNPSKRRRINEQVSIATGNEETLETNEEEVVMRSM